MAEKQEVDKVANASKAQQDTNSQETETVVFDGCLGLVLSISFSVLVFLDSIFVPYSNLFSIETIAFCMTITTAIFLALSCALTNKLQTKPGLKTAIVFYVASILGSLATSYFNLAHLSIIFAAITFVSCIFIYSPFLTTLKRGILVVLIDIIVIFTGVLFLLFTQLSFQFLIGVKLFITFIAALFTVVFCMHHSKDFVPISKEESQSRSIKTKGNKHTLFLDGFLFSASLGIFSITAISINAIIITIGTAFCLAGIFSSIVKNIGEKTYIETIQKSMALTSTLLIVAVLLNSYMQLIMFGIYIFIMSLHIITATNAVIETARFNEISPIWLLGKEGGIFFAGTAAGNILFGAAGYFIDTIEQIMIFTCVY